MTNYLFAYGTLRPSTIATHKLPGYAMYNYRKYPYIIRSPEHSVLGNLCAVTEAELAELDVYEGVDRGLYTREVVGCLNLETDEATICYAYIATPTLHPERIESGDWYNRGT